MYLKIIFMKINYSWNNATVNYGQHMMLLLLLHAHATGWRLWLLLFIPLIIGHA
jgi:hypothetical protein